MSVLNTGTYIFSLFSRSTSTGSVNTYRAHFSASKIKQFNHCAELNGLIIVRFQNMEDFSHISTTALCRIYVTPLVPCLLVEKRIPVQQTRAL